VRGRLAVVEGLTLARRPHREADRVAALYTAEFGKVPVRFPGVDRPQGKLRALAEPLVHADFRVYVRPGAEYATAAGGALRTTFPALRGSLDGTLRALGVLEILDRLTPLWQPDPGKLALTLGALGALEACRVGGRAAAEPWVYGAYALRLFEASGYGMARRAVSEENRVLWGVLHQAPWDEVAALAADAPRSAKLEALVATTVERVAERPLRWMQVKDKVRERVGA
jgi:DNA repair protein RecO (recombination protein O)